MEGVSRLCKSNRSIHDILIDLGGILDFKGKLLSNVFPIYAHIKGSYMSTSIYTH